MVDIYNNIDPEIIIHILSLAIFILPVIFFRNIIGVKCIGIFIPAILGYTFFNIGTQGAIVYSIILPIGLLISGGIQKLNITAASKHTINIFLYLKILIGLYITMIMIDNTIVTTGFVGLPIISIIYLQAGFHKIYDDKGFSDAVVTLIGSLFIGAFSFVLSKIIFFYTPHDIQSFFAIFFILFILSVIASFYSGARLFEYIRFKSLFFKGKFWDAFLGMNYRNIKLIDTKKRKEISQINNKNIFKKMLNAKGIKTSETLLLIKNSSEIKNIKNISSSFVIKPANGCAGRGILVINSVKKKKKFIDIKGNKLSYDQIHRHISNVLNGEFSMNEYDCDDVCIIEKKIVFPKQLQEFSTLGLPDIRTIYYKGAIIGAMMRIPTQESHGKGNLSQGALGAHINHKTGEILSYLNVKKSIRTFPKKKIFLPHWEKILEISVQSAQVTGLEYVGCDITYDQDQTPLIVECNARPGLEIQNVSRINLKKEIEKIDRYSQVEISTKRNSDT